MGSASKTGLLALVLIVVLAVLAVPAQANFVSTGQADNTKVSLTTTGTSKLQVSATAFVQCSDWTLTGSITTANRSTISIPVTGVTFSGCAATVFGVSATATVVDNGSDWVASAGASIGATSFSVSITTPTSVVITIPSTTCTIVIPKQTINNGIDVTNSNHSLSATVTGISFTSTNCAGAVPPSGTTAAFTGSFSDKTLVVNAV